MRGHLRERSPGHWAIVIDVRDPTVCRQSISDSWLGNLRECLAHLV